MKRIVRKSLKLVILFASLQFYFTGCGTVEQTIYLGDAEVTAPIILPPTHLGINKETGNVTLSPKVSVLINSTKLVGVAGERYSSSYHFPDNSEYRAKKENLEWNPLKYNFGLDIDWKVGDHVSLFGGINSSTEKHISLTGGNIGIGFHGHMQNPVFRFDLGLNIQKYNYFAVSVVHTKVTDIWGKTDEHWAIFGDKGNSINFNPFASLTIASYNELGFINYFGTIGVFSQSLLDFEPGETNFSYFPFIGTHSTVDERGSFISYSFYVNPGLSFTLSDYFRLLLSARTIKELSTSNDTWFIIPSLQVDFQI